MGNGSAVHLSSQIGFKEPESSSTITVNISTSRITRREMYFLSYNWRVIVEGACYKYLTLKLNNPSDFRYESGLSWYCTILFDYLKATYQGFEEDESRIRGLVSAIIHVVCSTLFAALPFNGAIASSIPVLVPTVNLNAIREAMSWTLRACLSNLYDEFCEVAWIKFFNRICRSEVAHGGHSSLQMFPVH